MANKMRRPGYSTGSSASPCWQTHEYERVADWYLDGGAMRYYPPYWQEWMDGAYKDVPWDGGAIYMQLHPEMLPPASYKLPPLYPNWPNRTPHPYYNGTGLPGGTKPLTDTAITEVIENKPAAAGTLTTHPNTSQTSQATAAGAKPAIKKQTVAERIAAIWARFAKTMSR